MIPESILQIAEATAWAQSLVRRNVIPELVLLNLRNWQQSQDELPVIKELLCEAQMNADKWHPLVDTVHSDRLSGYVQQEQESRDYVQWQSENEPGYWDLIEAEERAFTNE